MSLSWISFMLKVAIVERINASGTSLLVLLGAAIGIGAIAVLVGQWSIRWAIRRFDVSLHSEDRIPPSTDAALSRPSFTAKADTAKSENRNPAVENLSQLGDTAVPLEETTVATAKAETEATGNGLSDSGSGSSSPSRKKVKNAAERLGQVAKLAHTALSPQSENPSNPESNHNDQKPNSDSSRVSSVRTPKTNPSSSTTSNSSISRYERAEKRSNGGAIGGKAEVMVDYPKPSRSATSPPPRGNGNYSHHNPHTNGGSNREKLITVLRDFVASHQTGVAIAIGLLAADLLLWIFPHPPGYLFVEVPVSLGVAIAISWLGSLLFRDFFDGYLLDAALKEGRKLNSEFLILAKFTVNGLIVLIAVVAFAQTHQINIFGIVASLGIGGLAVAFAAQKTLEQLLGGIVIYLDRPFMVDDYIGLPDGTFGRVESIGLRSTKVRTSGKGTLVVVPNSVLTQINIENFTGAKKVMSIVYLNLYRVIPDDEKALIRQVILESTSDIFGIDSRSTDVTFRLMPKTSDRTQVQITFFILGSGEVSMELRRQVLDLANQNITQQLLDYGLRFDMEEPTIYVDSPITI